MISLAGLEEVLEEQVQSRELLGWLDLLEIGGKVVNII